MPSILLKPNSVISNDNWLEILPGDDPFISGLGDGLDSTYIYNEEIGSADIRLSLDDPNIEHSTKQFHTIQVRVRVRTLATNNSTISIFLLSETNDTIASNLDIVVSDSKYFQEFQINITGASFTIDDLNNYKIKILNVEYFSQVSEVILEATYTETSSIKLLNGLIKLDTGVIYIPN